MKNFNYKLVLDKVGTILVDRRLWVAAITIAGIIFGIPSFTDNTEALSQEAIDWVNLLTGIVGSLAVVVSLLASWAQRAPSGLSFKDIVGEADEVQSEVQKIIELLKEAGEKVNS